MIASIPVFVGIDVACAKRKRLPICFTTFNRNRLEPLEVPRELTARFPVGRGNDQITQDNPFRSEAETVADVLDDIAAKRAWRIVRVAIDAPHSNLRRAVEHQSCHYADAGCHPF